MQKPGRLPHQWPADVSGIRATTVALACRKRPLLAKRYLADPRGDLTTGGHQASGRAFHGRQVAILRRKRAKSRLPRNRVTDGSPWTINARVIGGRGIASIFAFSIRLPLPERPTHAIAEDLSPRSTALDGTEGPVRLNAVDMVTERAGFKNTDAKPMRLQSGLHWLRSIPTGSSRGPETWCPRGAPRFARLSRR
jgi:hypothetical protein